MIYLASDYCGPLELNSQGTLGNGAKHMVQSYFKE